jgi:predicted nucleic acid-binding OB-fold protein
LSLIKIASVKNKFARALLSEDWQRLTMSFDDVRERADSVNKPKARAKVVKHCPHCHMEI